MADQFCIGQDALTGATVAVRFAETIAEVAATEQAPTAGTLLSPGWIDIQINGFAGVDYCSPESPADEIARSIRALWATGVTRCLPTVITGPADDLARAVRNLARARQSLSTEGRSIAGIHVEGPHISPDDGPRGAHPKQCVRAPDLDELRRWIDESEGTVKLITVAPEWPEAPAYIEAAVDAGITISIGHTGAHAAQIHDAVSAGASMSTHLGNGAHATLTRRSNYIWEQMVEDRLTASFIVDGIHLDDAFLKTALRAKGIERSVLITDAVMPAGCEPGRYKLGLVEVELHPGGRVTLAGGDRLAGSSLTMDRGIANLIQRGGLPLADAVRMATVNPAKATRIAGCQRGLAEGEAGDLVEFRLGDSGEVVVNRVWLAGERVH